jgi:hypothetical protein
VGLSSCDRDNLNFEVFGRLSGGRELGCELLAVARDVADVLDGFPLLEVRGGMVWI